MLAAALLIAGPGRATAACTVDPDFLDGVGSGCARCSADGSKCEECVERYGLKKDGTCVPCQPVRVGKLLEEDAPVFCNKCDGEAPAVCQDCVFYDSGISSTTVSKMGGFPALFPNAKGECEYCPTAGCNKCLPGNGTCVECKVNHGAAPAEAGGVTCVECSGDLDPLMCRTCDAKDPTKCLECRYGRFLKDSQTCVDCEAVGLENCSECPSGETCQACYFGFSVDASGNCTACPDNCDECADGKCTTCSSGFGPDGNGGCAACKVASCMNCTASLDTCEPLGCDSGFYDAAKNACTPCAEGCIYCFGAADNCYSGCSEGYGLVAKPENKGTCERCSVENCAQCNSDASKCTECTSGFYLDQATGTCVKCFEGCSYCESGGSCLGCEPGLGLVNGTECQKCQSPNCSSCDEDLAACSLCLDPYYFSETTKKCEQCPAGCASCMSGQECNLCAEGFDWNSDSTACVKVAS